jgi:hypothetical protein
MTTLVGGRNRGRLASLTTTFTLMRSSDTSKVLHELNCSSLNPVASVLFRSSYTSWHAIARTTIRKTPDGFMIVLPIGIELSDQIQLVHTG